MARADTRLEPAPKIPPVTALKTVARVGRVLKPYRREVVLVAIGLVGAAAAVIADSPLRMPASSTGCWH